MTGHVYTLEKKPEKASIISTGQDSARESTKATIVKDDSPEIKVEDGKDGDKKSLIPTI